MTLPHCADAYALAEAIAHLCQDAHPYQDGWRARCPNHHGHSDTSMSITPADDRVLIKCFAECPQADIVRAVGLKMVDLFVQPSTNGHKRIVKVYDYFDASGTLVHQTVRYEPKEFRQRRPDPVNPGNYLWNLKGVDLVLYHLLHVLEGVQRGERIYLVEGEKDADALQALGLVATCNPMGAGKWRKSYTETLRGAHVVLLGDNDEAGLKHVMGIAHALDGTAATLKMIPSLHGGEPGGDISAWLKAGGTREGLEAVVANMPAWTAPPPETTTADTKRRNGHAAVQETTSSEAPLPYSDYTNALAFVRDYSQNLRYCYPWKLWLVWTGTHWQRDTSGAVMRMAKQTMKRLARHVEDLDDAAAKALMAHIKASLSTAKLKAMVECAQSEPGIPVQPEDLDTDRWLLNCGNGTLDLRTGKLRPHERADLLTFALPVAYEATASCPMWDAFLCRIMNENQNLIHFLQRAVGYALTGVIREHVLLILWGTGRNGKSTFLNTLRALLGSYAMKAPSELLMVSNNDRHPTERADLCGKRFVAAIETEQGRKLAEVFVKEATGGDPIRARRMREDFWEFQPTHKVFLATNHKPIITGTDTAIWERIRLVPFTVTIPPEERDTTLPEKLEQELPGILAWAIHGCLTWQQEGLGEPEEVQQATAGYRTEMDVLGQFIDECCLVGSNYRTKAADLYNLYKTWCDQQGVPYAIQRTWGTWLTERGFERFTNNGTWYRGLGIRERMEEPTEPTEPTEGKNGIHSSSNSSRGEIRKIPSVPSVPSVESSPEICRPCTVCGQSERWDDVGISRCIACWPPDRTKQAARNIDGIEV